MKISDLDPGPSPILTSQFPGVQNGKTWRWNLGDLLAALQTVIGAPLFSPHFEGTPTTPTPTVGANTTQIVNALWVNEEIAAALAGGGSAQLNTLLDNITASTVEVNPTAITAQTNVFTTVASGGAYCELPTLNTSLGPLAAATSLSILNYGANVLTVLGTAIGPNALSSVGIAPGGVATFTSRTTSGGSWIVK